MNFSNVFNVFKSRDYSLFFIGQLISRIGMWMQRTAVIWVVYSLTHSVLWVGITTFAEQFPSFLLSPAGGIAADRFNRFKVLMATQIGSALQAVALTVAWYYSAPLWVILLLSVLLGIANAFDVPARQAMINDIVNKGAHLPAALAMNASLNNFTRLAGPALSGIVLSGYGAVFCFATNAVSFIAVILCLNLIHFPDVIPSAAHKKPWNDFKEGWYYTIRDAEISGILSLAALLCLLVATYDTLQPYFASDVFKGDASTYGYINAASGFGALVSTLLLASQSDRSKLKKVLFYNLIMLSICLMLMGFATYLPVYLLLCFFSGAGIMATLPICNTVVQMVCEPGKRGRVVAFLAMATFGMLPLGSVLIGWLSKIIQPQNCLFLQGGICMVIAIVYYKFLSKDLIIAEDTNHKQPAKI